MILRRQQKESERKTRQFSLNLEESVNPTISSCNIRSSNGSNSNENEEV